MDMLWSGWGDQTEATALAPEVLGLLRGALGVRAGTPAVALEEVCLPEPRLGDAIRERLSGVVGAEHVSEDGPARVLHTRGSSTPDLLRIRSGQADDAPDAVVLPGSHDEVLDLLRVCSEKRVAVVPFGGGTSVVGGLEPRRDGFAAVVALDLRRLSRLLELDELSRTATLEPGLRGPAAEALLAERGYTIGHHLQSFEFATVGGFAAARSSGQASAGYGRFDERVVGLSRDSARHGRAGGGAEVGRRPGSASAVPWLGGRVRGDHGGAGRGAPGAGGAYLRGVALWVVCGWLDGLRRLVQDGPVPTVLRLSDEAETALNLARPTEPGAGSAGSCLAIAGFEGTEADVEARRGGVSAVLRQLGAELDLQAGRAWEHGRYRGPYLRDALLDAGALAETLETASFWSGLQGLYEAVGIALRDTLTALGTPPVVLCHVSHGYLSGASLYFTVGCAQLADPLARWRIAKAAASDAIIAAGGSITHHHGVGIDHREHLAREVGPLAVEALKAVKATFDPAGILNPGVLIG